MGDSSRQPPRVVIAGGGVAAIEGLIALRELLDGLVAVDLVTPAEDFVYRPLSVAEPFGLTEPRRFPLDAVAADHNAHLRRATVVAVDHEQGLVCLGDGAELPYDALLVAVGARPQEWLHGAVSFAGPDDVGRVRALVEQLDAGAIGSVAFAAPAGLTWTLPVYELALLASAHVGEYERGDVRLTVVSPEPDPLHVFGSAAAQHVRDLCANRGITLRTGTRVTSYADGRLALDPPAEVQADAVIALPRLVGEPIEGLPSGEDGFIPVDEHCAVRGLPGVYAAGDAVAYPVKQGGLATQQADAAAEAIAARLGAALRPQPFRPRLRGQLLTGLGPTYLTAGSTGPGSVESSIDANPLWWPPSKIAGRFLAPYLASQVAISGAAELQERPAVGESAAVDPAAEREEVRRLALWFAEKDAERGEYASAVGWLETIEHLDGLLSPPLSRKRADWSARVG
jgi:sulfide:quinone oxidoreductase